MSSSSSGAGTTVAEYATSPASTPRDGISGSMSGSAAVDQAIAGFTAGGVSTILLHPLDLIKTRFQVDSSRKTRTVWGGTVRAFKDVVRHEGALGLWRGLSPNFWGATLSWGLYFWWYDHIKRWMRGSSAKPDQQQIRLHAGQHLSAAGLAGTIISEPTLTSVRLKPCTTNSRGADRGWHKPAMGHQDSHVCSKGFRSRGVQKPHRRIQEDLSI